MECQFYSRYLPPPQVQLTCLDESRTQQQFLDESNINTILAKYIRTGHLETVAAGTYADVSEGYDYRQALHILQSGQETFDQLPATLRKRFENDPAIFMDFMHDEKNLEEMIQLGLANPKPAQNHLKSPSSTQNEPEPPKE